MEENLLGTQVCQGRLWAPRNASAHGRAAVGNPRDPKGYLLQSFLIYSVNLFRGFANVKENIHA
jgi:hypothetical protein